MRRLPRRSSTYKCSSTLSTSTSTWQLLGTAIDSTDRTPSYIMAKTVDSVIFSDNFNFSCGTITLDPVEGKMLLIRLVQNGEILLPKGRKNIGETLESAALRETHEETGFRVALFPLRFPTLATSAANVPKHQLSATTEPVAVSQRRDGNKVKIIIWFIAKGDSTAMPDTGTQQEGENFEPIWADFENGVKSLTFKDDQLIAQKAIDVLFSNAAETVIT